MGLQVTRKAAGRNGAKGFECAFYERCVCGWGLAKFTMQRTEEGLKE
jgi:hypothetical protein